MRLFLSLFLLFLCAPSRAQSDTADKVSFCGATYKKVKAIRKQLQPQYDFLRVQEGDTIVDIGAASGWYEGAFAAATNLQKVHFVLVDISRECLNREKVDNMIAHYSKVKGSAITHSFQLVNNTTDSLMLPLQAYRKVWMINTLHEIPDKASMAHNISNLLRPGGELVVQELISLKPGQLHGGCNLPLLTAEQMRQLFERAGLVFTEEQEFIRRKNKLHLRIMRFTRPLAE